MKKNTKIYIPKTFAVITVFLFSLSFNLKSQVFWTENFNNGCTSDCDAGAYVGPNGAWTVAQSGVNGVDNNVWYVSCAENGHTPGTCGTGCVAASATATLATLHIGSNASIFGDLGASYLASGGGFFDPETDLRAQSPTINCAGKTNITLSFNYITFGDPANDFAIVEFSTNNGGSWSTLTTPAQTTLCGPQGFWDVLSFNLPASCDNNPTVKIAFRWMNDDDGIGTDPSFAVDDVTLATPVVTTNTITTGTIVGGPFCACSVVNVPFTSTGTFNGGNDYTAFLSDATGNFAAGTPIGTLSSTANSGTIGCVIPCNTPAGTQYRIRVESTLPPIVGTDNGVDITITAAPLADFSYSSHSYCINAANQLPTFAFGASGGVFSSTAGLTLNPNGGNIVVAGSTAGTYVVTNSIAASGGCLATSDTFSVTILPLQDASFTYSSSTFCQSGTDPAASITGTPGGTFTSSPAGLVFLNASTGLIDLSASGINTYTVTYTTAGPCANTSTATVTITNNPVSTFSYGPPPASFCQNAADPFPTFSGGGSAGTFSSTGGLVFETGTGTGTGQIDLSASTPGTYTVTNSITITGCPSSSSTSQITIVAVQDSTFSYSSSTYCQSGTNPTPTVTTPGGTFSSSPAGLIFVSTTTGQINLTTSSLNAYTITYTTPGPCPTSLSVPVTITNNPVATFSYIANPYCQNSTNPLPTFSGGGTAGSFTSTLGLVFVNAGTGEINLAVSNPGTYIVTNTVGVLPCQATDTSTIIIVSAPISTFTYTGSPYCQSATNPFPTFSGGGVAGTFSSTAGLVFAAGTGTSTGEVDLAASTAGTYTIVNTVVNGSCQDTTQSSITITAPQVATFSYTGSPYCQNAANPAATLGAGATAGTFSSTPGLVFTSNTTGTINLAGSTAGSYTVTNSIGASGGCPSVSATSTVIINAAPNVSVNSPTICSGATANLVASGATTYTWSAGATSTGGGNATASPVVTTTFTVIGTTSGCSDTAFATVTIDPCNPPVANFTGSPLTICNAGCVDFTNQSTNNPTSWSWTFSGGVPSTSNSQGPINVCYSAPGDYPVTLTVTNANGSDSLTKTSYVHIVSPIPVNITGETTINACETTVLTASPVGSAYQWGGIPSSNIECPTCQSISVAPTATQRYYVNYVDANGCVDGDTTTVTVTEIYTYYMPTGIAPNSGGGNNELHVHGRGIESVDLRIFSRIGTKVFETTEINDDIVLGGKISGGWNGTYRGVSLNDNVYTYTLRVEYCNGEVVNEKGTITIVK